MKPIVRYVYAKPFLDRAIVLPLNHPNHIDGHGVTNGREAITSRVLSWDKSGRIETQHTLYFPLDTSEAPDQMSVIAGKPREVETQ
jgi:hypothetical protein